MNDRDLSAVDAGLSATGLGCMALSGFYGPASETQGIRTISTALDAGVNLLDTGDLYGMGHNELLIREALKHYRREEVFIAVKFGAQRSPDGGFVGIDCSPAAVKNSLAHTLTRLGTDYVDLYQPARIDPTVPIEETVGAIAEMKERGHVRTIGLSEAGVDTLHRAHREHPVAWLQIEYSLLSRGIEDDILPACRDLGVAISAYGVLARGLLSGRWSRSRELDGADFRSRLPRFQSGNLDTNLALVQALERIASERGCTTGQLAIAWVRAQGEDILPLIGARDPERLAESLQGAALRLTPEELERIDAAVPKGAAAGNRYDAEQMAILDSERSGDTPPE